MLKVIFVDDSKPRQALFENAVRESGLINHFTLIVCESADSARSELLEPADILILDVLLPKKDGGIAQASHSASLLDDLDNTAKPFIRPKTIIGLTADIDRLAAHQSKFLSTASLVLEGSLSKLDWLTTLTSQIKAHVEAAQRTARLVKDNLLITIHGIRTHGSWQADLVQEIKKYSRSFEFAEQKYGYLDILYFFFPSTRQKKARAVGARVARIIDLNQDKQISVVAHSFGSIILSEAFKQISASSTVENIIICGSPLLESTSIDHIVSRSKLTVNDCGASDSVLILSKLFVPGLGFAGRVGFQREHTSNFMNRYFKGGHSLYFSRIEDGNNFYSKHWSSIINGQAPETIDSRPNPIFNDLTAPIARIVSIVFSSSYTYIITALAALLIFAILR